MYRCTRLYLSGLRILSRASSFASFARARAREDTLPTAWMRGVVRVCARKGEGGVKEARRGKILTFHTTIDNV